MLRTQITKLARLPPSTLQRSFSVAAARSAEGEFSAPKSGGSQSGDSFQKREQANENMFIRQKEMESLKKLKEKLSQQRKHLDELDSHIAELEKERGGEHN